MPLPNPRNPRRRHGFTLIELLVVIAILAVLASILVPVIGKVREQARAADTRAHVGTLVALMQAYYNDHNAYPGPLSNMQLSTDMGGLTAPVIAPGGVAGSKDLNAPGRITANENAVLGLLGGLRPGVGTPPPVQYETAWVGTGPGWFGVTPKKIPAYGDTANLSLRQDGAELSGDFLDEMIDPSTPPPADKNDTTIPEFVDRFPDPLPLLILRARTGTRTTGTTASDNPIVTDGSTPARPGQYDLSQINGYVAETDPTRAIGIGKKVSDIEWTYPAAQVGTHGLRTVTYNSSVNKLKPDGTPEPNYSNPYDLWAALRSSSSPNTAKQKDGFIIISAGVDRVYGTEDDITNFGAY